MSSGRGPSGSARRKTYRTATLRIDQRWTVRHEGHAVGDPQAGQWYQRMNHAGTVCAIATSWQRVVVFDIPSGDRVETIDLQSHISGLEFTPDDEHMLVGEIGQYTTGGYVRVFSTSTWSVVSQLSFAGDLMGIAYHPQWDVLAGACYPWGELVESNVQFRSPFGQTGAPSNLSPLTRFSSMCWRPDGDYFAIAALGVRVYRVERQQSHLLVRRSMKLRLVGETGRPREDDNIHTLRFSPGDDSLLVASSTDYHAIYLFHFSDDDDDGRGVQHVSTLDVPRTSVGQYFTGQQIDVLDTVLMWYESRVVACDPDRNSICVHYNGWSSRWDEWLDIDNDAGRLAPLNTHTASRHVNENGRYLVGLGPTIAFSPSGRFLAHSASELRIWDLRQERVMFAELLDREELLREPPKSVEVSDSGAVMSVVCRRGSLRVFDLPAPFQLDQPHMMSFLLASRSEDSPLREAYFESFLFDKNTTYLIFQYLSGRLHGAQEDDDDYDAGASDE